MMDILDIGHWAGTEESLAAYLLTLKKFVAEGFPQKSAGPTADPDAPSRLITMTGDVAVIHIAGSLTNTDSWLNEFMGATGYPEIRKALVQAANDPAVGGIVLDVNSGGGSVAGVSDTAELITNIDKKIKPVHAFSDGAVMSAAYWLASSAHSLKLGKVAEAGSIGIMMVHKEVSKMLADSGINVTVMRAGEFKAAGNPYEPLSKVAKEQIQGQLDAMYTMFVEHVAQARGVTYAVADKMAQGRVFMGQQAVEAGLVDGIATFDAVVSKVQGGIDARKNKPKYGANFAKGTTLKTALTEQQIAILAEAGQPADVVGAAAAVEVVAAAAAAAAVVEAPAAAAAAPVVADKPDAGVLAYVQGQLAEANGKVTELTIELRGAKAEHDAVKGSHNAMRSIAADSANRMRVALGHSASATDAMTDTELLAEHASLRTQFETKFKAGGVASVSTESQAEAPNTVNPMRAARIAATRPATK